MLVYTQHVAHIFPAELSVNVIDPKFVDVPRLDILRLISLNH